MQIFREKPHNKRACVVPTCCFERLNLAHKFPMEDHRTQQWLNAINVKRLWDIPFDKLRTSYFVCSRHFRNNDYKNSISRYLNKTAIPSINLKNLNEIDLVLNRSCPRPKELLNIVMVEEELNDDEDRIAIMKRKFDDYENDQHGNPKNLNLNENFNEPQTIVDIPNQFFNESEIVHEKTKESNNFLMSIRSEYCDDVLSENDCGFEKNSNFSNNDENIDEMATTLEISHPDYLERLNLNFFWLRDHCLCTICYNNETHQRNYNILDISLNIKPQTTEVKGDKLFVKWDDNHQSEYDFVKLFKCCEPNNEITPSNLQILWNKEIIHDNELNFAKVDFSNYLKNENLAKDVVKSLLEFGFAFIENVPPNTDMTEMTIRHLFPIQKTFFGEMWTFSDKKDHADFAYTNKYLSPHTDNTYFNDPAGLQIFHCIKHTGNGGETILVDGFKILNDLKITNPKAYELLCKINVPDEFIENGQHHKYSAPIINLNHLNKLPEKIRFNLLDRSKFNAIPQNEMQHFYNSLWELTGMIQSPQNEYRFKLKPGCVLIIDNWRLLHGREKYNGERIMTGCYVSRTDFMSKARIFDLIS